VWKITAATYVLGEYENIRSKICNQEKWS